MEMQFLCRLEAKKSGMRNGKKPALMAFIARDGEEITVFMTMKN